MEIRLYKDLRLKNGEVYPAGTPAKIRPSKSDNMCIVNFGDADFTVRYSSVINPISRDEIEEAIFDGTCESISGEAVEPDGHDCDGFPSWLLALGLI